MRSKALLLPLLVLLSSSLAGCHGLTDDDEPEVVRPPAFTITKGATRLDPGPAIPRPAPVLDVVVGGKNATVRPGLEPVAAIRSWSLDWGDGSAPAQGEQTLPERLTHTYRKNGAFALTLSIVHLDGAAVSATAEATIGKSGSQARPYLTATPPEGPVPLVVGVKVDVRAIRAADARLPDGKGSRINIMSWRIDFGDGTNETGPFNPPRSLQHVYTHSGTYNLTLRAVTERDNVFTVDLPIIVLPPDDIEAWTLHRARPQLRATDDQGEPSRTLTLPQPETCDPCLHPMALEAVGGRLAVLAQREDGTAAVWVVDRATGRDIGLFPIPDRPSAIEADAHGLLWVTHRDDNETTVLDPEDGATRRVAIGLIGRPARLVFARDGSVGFAVQDPRGGSIAQLDLHAAAAETYAVLSPVETTAAAYAESDDVLALLDAMTGDVLLVRPGTSGPVPQGFVDLDLGDTVRPVTIGCDGRAHRCWTVHYDPVADRALVSSFDTKARLQASTRDAAPLSGSPIDTTVATDVPPRLRPTSLIMGPDGPVIAARDRDGRPHLILVDATSPEGTRTMALDQERPADESRDAPLRMALHPQHATILYWQDPTIGAWGVVDLETGAAVARHEGSAVPLGFHVALRATSS